MTGYFIEVKDGGWKKVGPSYRDLGRAEAARAGIMTDLRAQDSYSRPSHIRVRKSVNGAVTTVGREQYI